MAKAKGTKKAAQKPTPKEPKDICFIIIPFGGYFDSYYREIFVPSIEDAGLIPKRGDDLFRTGTIINDIWDYTKRAKLVLADLSTKNANVFYELGLAHAIKKPAILISQSIEDVPFDLRGLRVVPYDKNVANWGEILKENITKAITDTISSPLSSVLPTFLNDADIQNTEIKISKNDFLNLQNEIEQIKKSFQPNFLLPNYSTPAKTVTHLTDIHQQYTELLKATVFKGNVDNVKRILKNIEEMAHRIKDSGRVVLSKRADNVLNDAKLIAHKYSQIDSNT